MKRHAARGTFEHQVSTTPRAGCGGKRQYDTWQVAARMAKSTRRQRHTKVAPYKCHACGYFHVGEPAHPTVGRK